MIKYKIGNFKKLRKPRIEKKKYEEELTYKMWKSFLQESNWLLIL